MFWDSVLVGLAALTHWEVWVLSLFLVFLCNLPYYAEEALFSLFRVVPDRIFDPVDRWLLPLPEKINFLLKVTLVPVATLACLFILAPMIFAHADEAAWQFTLDIFTSLPDQFMDLLLFFLGVFIVLGILFGIPLINILAYIAALLVPFMALEYLLVIYVKYELGVELSEEMLQINGWYIFGMLAISFVFGITVLVLLRNLLKRFNLERVIFIHNPHFRKARQSDQTNDTRSDNDTDINTSSDEMRTEAAEREMGESEAGDGKVVYTLLGEYLAKPLLVILYTLPLFMYGAHLGSYIPGI